MADSKIVDVSSGGERGGPPSKYTLVLADHVTAPSEFILAVFRDVFGQTPEEAEDSLAALIQYGQITIGEYSHEVACTKGRQILWAAQSFDFTFHCSVRKI